MFNLSLSSFIPSSFTVKNGLVVLCKHIEEHENVKHEIRKYTLSIVTADKAFRVLIFHPGTKKPTYSNDIFDNGLYYPIKYELPGYCHWYNFDEGAFMISMIQKLVERERPDIKGMSVDKVELTYDDESSEIPCNIYLTTEKGEKIKIKHVVK